jgi:hypothetical protein
MHPEVFERSRRNQKSNPLTTYIFGVDNIRGLRATLLNDRNDRSDCATGRVGKCADLRTQVPIGGRSI